LLWIVPFSASVLLNIGKLRVFFSPPEEGNLKKSLKPKKKLGFFGKRIDFSVFNDTMKLSSFET